MTEIAKNTEILKTNQQNNMPEKKQEMLIIPEVFSDIKQNENYSETNENYHGADITYYENKKESIFVDIDGNKYRQGEVEDDFVGALHVAIDELSSKNKVFKEQLGNTPISVASSSIDIPSDTKDPEEQILLNKPSSLKGFYHSLFKRISIYEGHLREKGDTNETFTEKVKGAFYHEFGHQFDDSRTSKEEEALKKKLTPITKKYNNLSQKIKKLRAQSSYYYDIPESERKLIEQKIDELDSQRTNIDQENSKYMQEYLSKDTYSDTPEFKNAYLKDLKNFKRVFACHKLSQEQKDIAMKDVEYFTQGVDFSDGIDKTDIENSDIGRSETFAESFSLLMGGEPNICEVPNIFDKLFPHSMRAVKNIIKDNT